MQYRVINKAPKFYSEPFEAMLENFLQFAENELQLDQKYPFSIEFLSDVKNSKDMLGKTAHYSPGEHKVTVYVDNRHPKDVLRSISHELVHHCQNLRGDLHSPAAEGYAQNDQHLRKMEEEAYLRGNMIFRDWEDARKSKNEKLYEALIKRFV